MKVANSIREAGGLALSFYTVYRHPSLAVWTRVVQLLRQYKPTFFETSLPPGVISDELSNEVGSALVHLKGLHLSAREVAEAYKDLRPNVFIVHKASQVSRQRLQALLDDLRGHADALLLSEGDTDGFKMVKDAGFELATEVWPSMAESEMQKATSFASAFIYLQSAPQTGAVLHPWHEITHAVAAVKALTNVPVCCGFGIRTPEHVRQFARLTGCDGVIVGSELLGRLEQCRDDELADCMTEIERYLKSMVTSAPSLEEVSK